MQALSKVTLAAAAFVVLTSAAANAGERVIGAGVGAVSGAIVAGPVGFVGGGVIGYVAGPEIACGLGINRCYRHRHRHRRHYGHRAEGHSSSYRDDAGRRADHGNY
jgi:hypothetical protein